MHITQSFTFAVIYIYTLEGEISSLLGEKIKTLFSGKRNSIFPITQEVSHLSPTFLGRSSFPNTFSAKNTVISPKFVVWKFCERRQFPHSFELISRNYAETVPFYKIFTPGN